MKNYFALLTCLVLPITLVAQDLNCEDFKEGEFIGSTVSFPEVEWKIIRYNNKQIEVPTKVPQEYIDMGYPMDTLYSKLQWKDNCDYVFLFDSDKMKMDESLQEMNAYGGLYISKEKIEGKCFYYKSKSVINGEEVILQGKICKVE